VEAEPEGYTNWKTTGDGKTAYLSLAAVNGADLKSLLNSALVRVGNQEVSIDGVIQQPHDQTATITGLLDNNASATVKGNLTDTQWDGVADKIKTTINARFATRSDTLKATWRELFGRNVTIIVEKSPSGYTNWKTVSDGTTPYGDGKTIYLSLAATNDDNFESLISLAISRAANHDISIDGNP
jgi:hypothetical protein